MSEQTPEQAVVPATEAPAATPVAPAPPLEFAVNWEQLRTRDLLLFQKLGQMETMSEGDKNALTLEMAPMLDRMIVGGMPDLPMEQYGDIITTFFAKMQERGNTKN